MKAKEIIHRRHIASRGDPYTTFFEGRRENKVKRDRRFHKRTREGDFRGTSACIHYF